MILYVLAIAIFMGGANGDVIVREYRGGNLRTKEQCEAVGRAVLLYTQKWTSKGRFDIRFLCEREGYEV